jgi:hypothetical protein
MDVAWSKTIADRSKMGVDLSERKRVRELERIQRKRKPTQPFIFRQTHTPTEGCRL